MDPTEFRQRFADWKAGKKVYDAGKPVEDDYEKFKRTLPPNQRNASEYDYSTRRYWELNGKPKDFDEAVKRNMYTLDDDGFYHAASIAWTPEGDAEFMKPNVHPTKHFEDEFYESNPKFQKKYRRTFDWTRPCFSKYERNISPLDYINLPKYDSGENPWIPKGTKVPTENGKEVVVSAQPKTTVVSKQRPSVDDNLTEQQRGQAYLRHLYNIDKPLSGEDPIGELVVEGAALGPVFKGLGWVGKQVVKQAMPYIGRALKPVTNWFAAKALSNSIDDVVATPTFSKVLPATEQIWQDLNLPRRSYKSGSMSGPFTEEVFRRNGIFDAFDAFDNQARKQLVDRLSEEAGFPLQISTGHGKLPGTIKILTDLDADKILGKNVFGKRDGYTLYVRESADPTTMFHEALHLQGFGNVDWDWPKLQSLLDDYQKKGLKLAQLESSGAPFMQIRDAKRDYYAAEQAYKQLFEQKTATEQFLKQKVESVLRDDAEEYIRQPHEFVVHGLQAGRKVGLKPYQPEPTYDPYNTGVPIVDFGKIMETVHSAIKKHDWMADLKLDTPQNYHNAWKVLTGNFLPAAVITGGTFGALQEHDKGKSIHINPANKGKFNATKKRTGKTTEQLAHSKNPLTRKRAIFALNSRKFKH